ncbi:chitotriosidase-1 [Patella vulgata]|uniref:chitotriosidase-1 n=1 Tax=Patella vulgata TaxID=6465 RepID=UPI00217FDA4B|nr:chitotriosidase-1 [Patella vulgata]
MMKLVLVTVAVYLLQAVSLSEGAGCQRRVCYHTNWSQYRPVGGKFKPNNIDPSLCSHIIYAFAKLVGNNLKAFEWNDESTDWMVGLYAEFTNLKKSNPGLKTMLGVGGWNMGSGPFHAMVATAAGRNAFATSTVQFLRKRNFDGLDLDWEYPANRGSPPQDKGLFTELVKEIQAAFRADAQQSGKPKLILSSAVGAGKDKIDTAYDVPAISKELDFINLMTYDLHGSWESFTGHNAPLYARSDEKGDQALLNVDWAARYWVQKGAPKNKINVGIDLYGRAFTLKDPNHSLPGDPTSGPGHAGKFTREAGFLSYYEICDIKKSGGQVHRIKEQDVPYIVKGDQWIGYDDTTSIREKARYVKDNGFGGVMVWALDLDDFQGTCGEGKYPLMKAVNDECNTPSTGNHQHNTPRPNVVVTVGPQITQPTNHHVDHSTDFSCINKPDGFYPSATSCEHYYICTTGNSFSVACAQGLVFNPNTRFCDWPKNYQCTTGGQVTQPVNHVTPVPQTQRPVGTVTHSTSVLNESNYCKDKSDGIMKDPMDPCNAFFECANGITYKISCPPGTKFREDIKLCDMPQNVQGC